MIHRRQRFFDRTIALALPLLAVALWVLLPGPAAERFTGWVISLLPIAAAVLILRQAGRLQNSPQPRIFRMFFPPEITTSLVIFLVGGITPIGWGAGLRAALVFAAWVWLCGGIARATRRLGTGPAITLSLLLSMALLAAPVVFSPALHISGIHAQHLLGACLAYACPALAEISALPQSLRTDWSVLPGMYAYSGLGQEVPIAFPSWWITALLFAAVGQALQALAMLAKPRH